MTHKFKHPGYFEAVRWDGTEETHKYIRDLIGKALLHSTTVSNHDKSFLIRVASDDEGTTRVYNGNWIMKWFDGTLAVRTDDDFRSWLGKLVQPMDETDGFIAKTRRCHCVDRSVSARTSWRRKTLSLKKMGM